mmetsp:Transcript_1531/g.1919  ORF Transcript_1531/g.1919 Transcript_1531/m.1919 type:complete len:174 (+) Transcript_1531:498-1019(+)
MLYFHGMMMLLLCQDFVHTSSNEEGGSHILNFLVSTFMVLAYHAMNQATLAAKYGTLSFEPVLEVSEENLNLKMRKKCEPSCTSHRPHRILAGLVESPTFHPSVPEQRTLSLCVQFETRIVPSSTSRNLHTSHPPRVCVMLNFPPHAWQLHSLESNKDEMEQSSPDKNSICHF